MKRHDLSRKEFLSLGVLGGLVLLDACSLDDTAPVTPSGSGGSAGSGGASSASTATTSGASGGGSAGASSSSSSAGGVSTSGSAGSGGATTGGAGGSGSGGSAGGATGGGGTTGGSGGAAGQDGGADSAASDSGGSVDARADVAMFDAGACGTSIGAAISMNHDQAGNGPHRLVIPMADVVAGIDKLYQTVSTPGMIPQSHEHWVMITAADFARLRAGMAVMKKSCESHEHQYAIRCGTMPTAPAGTICLPTDSCGSMIEPC